MGRPRLSDRHRLAPVPRRRRLPDELDGLTDTLVVANEWLDVVPCTIAEVDENGELREVLVDRLDRGRRTR